MALQKDHSYLFVLTLSSQVEIKLFLIPAPLMQIYLTHCSSEYINWQFKLNVKSLRFCISFENSQI